MGGIEGIEDFEEWYGENTDGQSLDSLRSLRLFLIGLGADDRTERMARFLAANTSMEISLLTFDGIAYDGKTLLARQVEVEAVADPGPPNKVLQGLLAEPNVRLFPQAGRDQGVIWSQASTIQIARGVRYNSQRDMTPRTSSRILGIRACFALTVRAEGHEIKVLREIALALWLNSTLGLLQHAGHANRTQFGRGRGNKGMLATLPTLDVCQLRSWQLDEAQSIWWDIQGRTFDSFHRRAVDRARTELDRRIITDMLALPTEAQGSVSRLRDLLVTDPSIHGGKEPELPI